MRWTQTPLPSGYHIKYFSTLIQLPTSVIARDERSNRFWLAKSSGQDHPSLILICESIAAPLNFAARNSFELGSST